MLGVTVQARLVLGYTWGRGAGYDRGGGSVDQVGGLPGVEVGEHVEGKQNDGNEQHEEKKSHEQPLPPSSCQAVPEPAFAPR